MAAEVRRSIKMFKEAHRQLKRWVADNDEETMVEFVSNAVIERIAKKKLKKKEIIKTH